MIDELDETLRTLLIRDLKIEEAEVDVAFDQPKREWSSRLMKPTLNLFLFDVRENALMRQMSPTTMRREGSDKQSEKRGPLRLDLSYLITAWASDPLDEHRMLARTLMVLCRYLSLPTELLPEIISVEGVPVNMQIARDEGPPKPSDIWAAMDNEARPSLSLLVTAPLNPHAPFESFLIRTATFDFVKKDENYIALADRVYDDHRPVEGAYPRHDKDTERLKLPKQNTDRFNLDPIKLSRGIAWLETDLRVERNGKDEVVQQRERLSRAQLRVLETDQRIQLSQDDQGEFVMRQLWPGEFHLDIAPEGAPVVRQTFTVPSPTGQYEFVVKADPRQRPKQKAS